MPRADFWSAELDRHIISVPEKRPILISTYPYAAEQLALDAVGMQCGLNCSSCIAPEALHTDMHARARRSEDRMLRLLLRCKNVSLGTGIAVDFAELISTSRISSNYQIQIQCRGCEGMPRLSHIFGQGISRCC